jgi:hypothetical protein
MGIPKDIFFFGVFFCCVLPFISILSHLAVCVRASAPALMRGRGPDSRDVFERCCRNGAVYTTVVDSLILVSRFFAIYVFHSPCCQRGPF